MAEPSPSSVPIVGKPRKLAGDRGPAPLVALTWSSFFGAGYVPVAPGTAGTVAAIPLWWILTDARVPPWLYVAATVVVTLTGMLAAQRAGKYYGVADSGHIVIDEVAGYLVTMAFLPRTVLAAAVGFVFFTSSMCSSLLRRASSIATRAGRTAPAWCSTTSGPASGPRRPPGRSCCWCFTSAGRGRRRAA